MTILDHVLALVLVVVVPPYSVLSYRRFQRRVATGGSQARRRGYLATVIQQWTVTAIVMGSFALSQRPLSDLGLSQPSGWGMAVGIGLTAALVGLLFVQLAHVDDPAVRDAVRAKLSHVQAFLPQDDADERLFMAVAATAGICEEIIYRGFLTWYAAQYMPTAAAIGVAAVVFGLGHAYQGPKGIAVTGIVGLVMSGLVVLTGSLWIAMAIHAFIDLNSGLMARRALTGAAPVSPP